MACIGIAIAGALYVPARVYLDTKTVRTELVRVRIQGLPDDLDGLKIVHISDLQSEKVLMTFVTNIYSKRPNAESLKALVSKNPIHPLKVFVTHQPSKGLVESA